MEPIGCLLQAPARIQDYRCITIAATISSPKKIGSNSGGTSHSRRLNFVTLDISDRPSRRRERNDLSVTDNSRVDAR